MGFFLPPYVSLISRKAVGGLCHFAQRGVPSFIYGTRQSHGVSSYIVATGALGGPSLAGLTACMAHSPRQPSPPPTCA